MTDFKPPVKALGMAFGLMIGTMIYGAIAHPHDLAVIWIDKGGLMGIGSIIANAFSKHD